MSTSLIEGKIKAYQQAYWMSTSIVDIKMYKNVFKQKIKLKWCSFFLSLKNIVDSSIFSHFDNEWSLQILIINFDN